MVSSSKHLLGSAKKDIRGGEIVQGLVVTLVVVIVHKAGNFNLKLGREEIILQVHNVLHRTVVAFNLALGHRVVRGRVGMLDVPAFQKRS